MDDALVIQLNRLTRSSALRVPVASLAQWLSYVEIVLMLLLAISGRRRTALRMLVAVALVYVVSEVLGLVWPRRRPFARLPELEALAPHSPERSFPSRHMASGLAMAAVGGRDHARLAAAMGGIAWLLGIARVAAGLHYPTDVAAGAVIGAAIGHYLRGRMPDASHQH